MPFLIFFLSEGDRGVMVIIRCSARVVVGILWKFIALRLFEFCSAPSGVATVRLPVWYLGWLLVLSGTCCCAVLSKRILGGRAFFGSARADVLSGIATLAAASGIAWVLFVGCRI